MKPFEIISMQMDFLFNEGRKLANKKHLEEVDNGEGDRAYEERVDNELSDHD